MNTNDKKKQKVQKSQEQLGSWTEEMIKPENLDPRTFHSAEELMAAILDDKE